MDRWASSLTTFSNKTNLNNTPFSKYYKIVAPDDDHTSFFQFFNVTKL